MPRVGLLTDRAVERLAGQAEQLAADVTTHASAGIDAHADTGLMHAPFYELQLPSQTAAAKSVALTAKLPVGSLAVVVPAVLL